MGYGAVVQKQLIDAKTILFVLEYALRPSEELNQN